MQKSDFKITHRTETESFRSGFFNIHSRGCSYLSFGMYSYDSPLRVIRFAFEDNAKIEIYISMKIAPYVLAFQKVAPTIYLHNAQVEVNFDKDLKAITYFFNVNSSQIQEELSDAIRAIFNSIAKLNSTRVNKIV